MHMKYSAVSRIIQGNCINRFYFRTFTSVDGKPIFTIFCQFFYSQNPNMPMISTIQFLILTAKVTLLREPSNKTLTASPQRVTIVSSDPSGSLLLYCSIRASAIALAELENELTNTFTKVGVGGMFTSH